MTRPGARGVFGEEGWEGHHCICSLACNRPQITTRDTELARLPYSLQIVVEDHSNRSVYV